MHMPIPIIYLDSQDYSHITDPRFADQDNFRNLREHLELLSKDGRALFPYSNLHVQEAAPHDVSDPPLSLLRAREMKLLARRNVFLPFEYMLEREVTNAALDLGLVQNDKIVRSDEIVRADGIWWPWEQLKSEDSSSFLGQVMQLVSPDNGLPRDRQARREFERKQAKTSARLQKFLVSNLPQMESWLGANFPPISRSEAKKLLLQFVMGEMDASTFYNALMTAALDLENFIGWTVARFRGAADAADYLRTSGYGYATNMMSFVDKLPAPSTLGQYSKEQERELLERKEGLANVTSRFRQSMVEEGFKMMYNRINDADRKPNEAEIKTLASNAMLQLPGIQQVASTFGVWLSLITQPSQSRQRVKRSDVLDILHTIYLPYVDIFRVDVNFNNTLLQTKSPHLSRVVAKSDQLASRIDNLLAARS